MTLANKITISRILLVPIFIWFLYLPLPWMAIVVFVVAAGTDWLDGFIARKYNQTTTFGKFADPIADKLLITAALIVLAEMRAIEGWMVIVIIARDLMVDSLRMIAVAEGKVIVANIWGKIKTVVQMLAIFAFLLVMVVPFSVAWEFYTAASILIWLAVILTVVSGVIYLVQNRKVIDSI